MNEETEALLYRQSESEQGLLNAGTGTPEQLQAPAPCPPRPPSLFHSAHGIQPQEGAGVLEVGV